MAEERARRILLHACGGNPWGIRSESGAPAGAPPVIPSQCGQSEQVGKDPYWSEVRSSGANSVLSAAASAAPASGGGLGEVFPTPGELLPMEIQHQFRHPLDSNPTSTSSNSSASSASSSAAVPAAAMDQVRVDDVAAAGSVANSIASRVRSSQGQNWAAGDWPVADDCIFCKIIHGFAPAFKLYEDDFCICILDINPLCYGHSLLVPKGHFPSLDLPWRLPCVALCLCSATRLWPQLHVVRTSRVRKSSASTLSFFSLFSYLELPDSFNMVVNNGEAAGQVVFHTHFHIVPRYSGDGLWTNESVVRKSLSTFKDPAQLAMSVRSILRNRS